MSLGNVFSKVMDTVKNTVISNIDGAVSLNVDFKGKENSVIATMCDGVEFSVKLKCKNDDNFDIQIKDGRLSLEIKKSPKLTA